MVARVARYEVPQDRIDDAVAAFGEAGAQIENLDGFAGGYVLIDQEDGRTMTITLWQNSAAMERLSDEHRDVVACRYLLELSEEETAAALRIRRGTVKSRVARALERLRAELGEEL